MKTFKAFFSSSLTESVKFQVNLSSGFRGGEAYHAYSARKCISIEFWESFDACL